MQEYAKIRIQIQNEGKKICVLSALLISCLFLFPDIRSFVVSSGCNKSPAFLT